MDKLLKPTRAELLGPFMLTFIGAGAGALAGTNGGGIIAVGLGMAWRSWSSAMRWAPSRTRM